MKQLDTARRCGKSSGKLLVIQCRYGPPRLSCADATETSPAVIRYSPSAACSNEGLRTRPGQMRTNEPEKQND